MAEEASITFRFEDSTGGTAATPTGQGPLATVPRTNPTTVTQEQARPEPMSSAKKPPISAQEIASAAKQKPGAMPAPAAANVKPGKSAHEIPAPDSFEKGVEGAFSKATQGGPVGGVNPMALASAAGPVGVAAGLTGAAIGIGVKVADLTNKYIEARTDDLANYSPAIAIERAKQSVKDIQFNLRQSEKLGEDLAQIEALKGNLSRSVIAGSDQSLVDFLDASKALAQGNDPLGNIGKGAKSFFGITLFEEMLAELKKQNEPNPELKDPFNWFAKQPFPEPIAFQFADMAGGVQRRNDFRLADPALPLQ